MYWSLRLEGLRVSPESFGSSYEESVLLTMAEVKQRMNNTEEDYILGAFNEERHIVGMAGFVRERRIKLQHKAMIWGVYVTPAYQGKGIAGQLMREILERGRALEGLDQINLCVVTTNEAAVALYTKLGFQMYGTERNALKVNGKSLDELHMAYYYVR